MIRDLRFFLVFLESSTEAFHHIILMPMILEREFGDIKCDSPIYFDETRKPPVGHISGFFFLPTVGSDSLGI